MTGTTTQRPQWPVPAERQGRVDEYADSLVSGRAFALHAASARSRHGYMPPIGHREWATCMGRIAKMARQSDALAQVAAKIMGRVNLYGDDGQATAAVYDAAGEALAEGFDDVIGRTGPEAGRPSSYHRDYTLGERATLLAHLIHAVAPFTKQGGGLGWCLAAIVKELHCRVPQDASDPKGWG